MNLLKQKKFLLFPIFLLLCSIVVVPVWAQKISTAPSVTVNNKLVAQGYTLFAPVNSKTTYLINNKGQLIHTWQSQYYPGVEVSLLENGQLLRTTQITPTNFTMGGAGGGVELLNWDGSVAWNYTYASDEHIQHHDAQVMPNGHILMLAWELEPKDKAIAAGVNPANIDPKSSSTWAESVIELDPATKQTVWEWHTWDHMVQNYDGAKANYGVVKDHPELINANYYKYAQKPDWMHANSIDYNPKTDQILLSVREFNEIWIIDHSTTTQQAASHTDGKSGKGGDLLYRWGNPETYGSGTVADRKLYLQHNANWIKDGLDGAGDILIFNDGDVSRPYSSIEQIAPPVSGNGYNPDFGQTKVTWTYTASDKTSFYGSYLGGVQRLANGDTFVTQGPQGRLFEINKAGKIVWDFTSPITLPSLINPGTAAEDIFRAYKYAPDYPGLQGKNLKPKGKLTAQS